MYFIGNLADEVCCNIVKGEKISMNYDNDGNLQLQTGSPENGDLRPQSPVDKQLDEGYYQTV